MLRALRTGGALALLVLAWAGPAAAAGSPTLGGRLSPVPVIWERGQSLSVTNLSTIPVTVALAFPAGDGGWQLADSTFALAVNQTRAVSVTRAGEGPAALAVSFSAESQPKGEEHVGLVLETALRHETLMERVGGLIALPIGLGLIGLLFVGVAYGLARRRQ